MDSWELSKENFQPLRQGRKVSSLEEQDHKKISEEKQAFEMALRTYNGTDPLEPWYKYIIWVEQTFAKGGKEGNLQELLEKCIKQFKDDPIHSQDERYLEVWMKYATTSPTPLDIFKFMATENICTTRANFYFHWAWELEQADNLKHAEKVFVRGMSHVKDEAGLKFLETKHKQFQARVMKRILEKSEDEDLTRQEPGSDEKRAVLASLKGHGKQQKVGSIRVGEAKKSDGPGALLAVSAALGASKVGANSKSAIKIFCDSENEPPSSSGPLPSSSSTSSSLPFHRDRNRENELSAGKWSQAKIGKKSHAVPLDKIDAKQTFTIHSDETEPGGGAASSSRGTSSTSSLSTPKNVLAVRKPAEEHNVALALFEPPNPMMQPMYCKHLVYQGITEFSFEELRAIKYRQKLAEQEVARMEEEKARWRMMQARELEELERQRVETEKARLALEKQRMVEHQRLLEEMERKKEEFERWVEDQKKEMAAAAMAVKPVVIEKKENRSNIGKEVSLPEKNSASSSALDDTKALLMQKTLISENSETSGRQSADLQRVPSPTSLTMPSPTMNTKAAINLVQQMWFKPDVSENQSTENFQEESVMTTPRLPPTHFQIYEDPPETAPIAKSTAAPAAQSSSSAPFTIYSDETDNQPQLPPPPTKPIVGAGPSFPIFCDENVPPPASSASKPPKRALGMAKPIFAKPLPVAAADKENQAKVFSDENALQAPASAEPIQLPPPPSSANMTFDDAHTIRLPSMEAFAQLARVSSTPFHGKQFMPEVDDMTTCNIELISSKKPQEAIANNDEIKKTEEVFKTPSSKFGQPSSAAAPADDTPAASNGAVGPSGLAATFDRQPALSPIMETSRENWKSSSSSSSNASSVAHLTKTPHWGQTQMSVNATSASSNTIGRTPGTGLTGLKPMESSCMSGYIADNSSARTPGIFLGQKRTDDKLQQQQPPPSKPSSQEQIGQPSKPHSNLKTLPPAMDMEEDDDICGGMMAEFQKNAGLAAMPAPSATTTATPTVTKSSFRPAGVGRDDTLAAGDDMTLPLSSRKLDKSSFQCRNINSGSSFLSDSLKMSFLAPCVENSPMADPIMAEDNCTMGGLGLSIPRSPASPMFDATGLSMMAPPSLDMTEVSHVQLDPPASGNDSTAECNVSALPDNSNPFSVDMHLRLLTRLKRPVSMRHGYKRVRGCVPNIRPNSDVNIADVGFCIMGCEGQGAFGKVFKAVRRGDSNPNETIANIDVVLKLQKPAREWEFYICTELHDRLSQSGNDRDRRWFMSIPRCYTFDDGSVFVSEHHSNTLLNICNKVSLLKANEVEAVAVYFTIEMLRIVEALQKAKIIHADIKPENFLLQRMPSINTTAPSAAAMFEQALPALQVIDFGVSIDLNLFPAGTVFTQSFEKAENKSPEMLDGRPWTYQLDYFGIACVSYTLLHSSYMKLIKTSGRFAPSGALKRWWNNELWSDFFDKFLNIPNCQELPNLSEMRQSFENYFFEKLATKFACAVKDLSKY